MKAGWLGFMLAALLWLCSSRVSADIQIREAWASRPLTERSTSVAAFAILFNSGHTPVSIIGAASDSAATVQLHRIVHEQGIVRMRPVPEITIPPGEELRLSADGVHLMLMGLQKAQWEVSHIRIQLQLDSGHGISEDFELRGFDQSKPQSRR